VDKVAEQGTRRQELLRLLYDVTGGRAGVPITWRQFVDQHGLNLIEYRTNVRYLHDEGWVTFTSNDRIALTHQGIKEMERILATPRAAIDNQPFARCVRLKEILIDRATGRGEAQAEYAELRKDLMSDSRVKERLPKFVKDQRTLREFWDFIQPKHNNYHDRRAYLDGEFKSLLDAMENVGVKIAEPHGITVPSFSTVIKNKVFVVHGHDETAKVKVARLIEAQGIQAIILGEQLKGGRTIIENFEHHADVDFAVVLLTPDDVGASAKTPGMLTPRARQNVIFELGYFVAKLGRDRVIALYKEGVDIPSDFQGVLYERFDDQGNWRIAVLQELAVTGYHVDINKIV